MKTKQELDALKIEVETMNRKLAELSEDELRQINGGFGTKILYSFDAGDCFETADGSIRYRVNKTYKDIDARTEISVHRIFADGTVNDWSHQAQMIAGMKYLGKNAF